MKDYVKINYDGSWLICTVLEALDFVKEADNPEEYTFEIVRLLDEEYENLPEFSGF